MNLGSTRRPVDQRRRYLTMAAASLVCVLAAACGDVPQTPNPDHLPSAGLLHVAQKDYIATYRIYGGEGGIVPAGGQPLVGVQTLAAHPSGQFLFAGVAPEGTGGGVTVFSVNQNTAALTAIATAPSLLRGPRWQWQWLEANETRLVAMIRWFSGSHDEYCFWSYPFNRDGTLGSPTWLSFNWSEDRDRDWGALGDLRSELLFKENYRSLDAYSLQGEGTLELKVSTKLPFSRIRPVAAGDGFVFTEVAELGTRGLFSHRGTTLDGGSYYPLSSAGNDDPLSAAFFPAAAERPALLAVGAAVYQDPVHILAIAKDGRFEPQLTLPGPQEAVRELLFHPQLRLLFAIGRSVVTVYSIDETSGRLVDTAPGNPPCDVYPTLGRPRMAITLPPS